MILRVPSTICCGDVLDRLREIACPNDELRMWRSYFQERRAGMCNNIEVERMVERGCPQGSAGIPIPWNLCMDELLVTLCVWDIIVVAYADDLLILVEGNTRVTVKSRAAEITKIFYDWGVKVGVKVSESKIVFMLLKGGMEMMNRWVHVQVNENVKSFKFVNKVKYLRVNVGVNMDFRVHVKGLRETVWNN